MHYLLYVHYNTIQCITIYTLSTVRTLQHNRMHYNTYTIDSSYITFYQLKCTGFMVRGWNSTQWVPRPFAGVERPKRGADRPMHLVPRLKKT